jgi:hypothetical protein
LLGISSTDGMGCTSGKQGTQHDPVMQSPRPAVTMPLLQGWWANLGLHLCIARCLVGLADPTNKQQRMNKQQCTCAHMHTHTQDTHPHTHAHARLVLVDKCQVSPEHCQNIMEQFCRMPTKACTLRC